MSILKEINDLHDSLKAFTINIFLIPFWYVALFLFNNEFYSSSDNLIILAMTIVISLTSSGVTTFLLHIIQKSEGETGVFIDQMMISVTALCIWLSLLIFIVYSLGFLFDIYIYFYYFLILYYTPMVLLYIRKLFKKNKKKNKQSNSTTDKK